MKHSHFNRIISMFIAFAMLLTMVPAFAANPSQFVDFPTGWSKAAMSFSVDNGLLNGKSANKIEPQSNLTRAEMATIINRAFGAQVKGDISSYTDVKTSDWFYTEMQKAVNMQTFQGDGNGKLRPNSAITREEVMTAIARAIVLETSDYSSIAKFNDYSSISDWAKPYVAALISKGYVNGYEDGTVRPNANITREEFAQLMYNIFKTYLTVSGTTYNSVYKQNCVMINNKNINLSNVIVYGDLVLGDGVGTSKINLTNVTINGRLVARGGIITLKNVTTGGGVVVKNVNGTTHFNNYRTDAVFTGVVEHTYTTYLTPSFVTGGGNRPGAPSDVYYTITIEHPDGSKEEVEVKSGTLFADAYKQAFGDETVDTEYKIGENTYGVDWFDGDGNLITDSSRIYETDTITYKLYAKLTVDYKYNLEQGDTNIKIEDKKVYVDSQNYTYSMDTVLPVVDPERTYYTFNGWKGSDGKGYELSDSNVTVSPLTINAIWIAKAFSVEYEIDNSYGAKFKDSFVMTDYDSYSCDAIFVLPTKNDIDFDTTKYEFMGWYDNPEFTGSAITKIDDHSTTGDKTYYLYLADKTTITTHTVKFYANADETNGLVYVGQLDNIVYGTSVGEELDGSISNTVKNLYLEITDDDDQDEIASQYKKFDLWNYGTHDDVLSFVLSGFKDNETGKYHYIYPDLVYKDTDGKWKVFDGKTPVTKDMKVYGVKKYASMVAKGSIAGIKLPDWGAELKTPYSSTTRFVDSVKDAMYLSRNNFATVLNDDFYNKLFAKLAPKSKGIIDENGYLQNLEFSMLISQVISVDEIEKEIRNYLTRILEKGTEDEIRQLVELVHLETFIDHIGIVKLAELVGYDVVRDAVMSADNRDTLIKYIQDQLAAESNDFRNILLGNTAFLEAALSSSDIKDAVIDAIIANPDILINVLNVGTNKETFINEAVKQPAFINALLTNETFEAKIIDLIHHDTEDKAAFKALIEKDDNVRNQIFDEAVTHKEVVYYLEHDAAFLGHIVDILNGGDYAKIFNGISDSDDFRAQLETAIGNPLSDTEYTDIINGYVYEDPANDTVNGKITKELEAILDAYNPESTTGIDKAITDYVVSVIDNYIANGTCDFDSHIQKLIIDFVSDYLDENIADKTVDDVIDDVVLNYIERYMNYTDADWTALGDDYLKTFVLKIKGDFIKYAKETEMTENYKSVIRTFVTKEDNNSVVTGLFNRYYDTMKSYIVDNVNDSTVNPELHKIIKAQAKADNTYNILSTFIAENEVYIKQTVLADEELKKYIEKFANDGTFKTFVTEKVTTDTVVKFVLDIRVPDPENPNQLSDFIDEAINMLKGLDYYKNFIKCFSNKEATYHIDKSDIHFALAVGEAVQGYTFDEALQLLGGGPVYELINRIGKDKFEDIYNNSRDEFNNGIIDISDKIFGNTEKGIVADENYSQDYPMSLSMKIEFAKMIAEYYTKLHDKIQDKLEAKAPYYYTQNQYIKDFVANINVDTYLGFDASKVTDKNSGYYIKSFMDYYDIMYDNLVLLDKAILWYGADAPDDLLNLRDDIANDVLKLINKLQSILAGLDEGGELVGGYTMTDIISKVNSLKELGDKVPVSAIETIVDNICTILSKIENGEVIAKGYTMDDLVELSERLDLAIKALRDEDYEKLDKELGDIINKTVSKAHEIIKELDTDGTILGKITLDELAAKVDAINKIYVKFEDKIDALISKLADMNPGNVGDKVDTEYWEDVIFGTDYENRFNLDDVFDLSAKVLDKIRDDNPENDGTMLIIDPYKVSAGSSTVTVTRYMK